MKLKNIALTDTKISLLEFILILGFSAIPLFFSFPYRINIFLSWEGAYRLYLGQVPYRDFGLPMGFAYWVIPAMFFKIFGPYLITLIKAQAFINILSALAFRSILKSLFVKPAVRLLSILLFLISFSFVNFWPWYNHSVIVFELIAIAFLLRFIFRENAKYRLLNLFLGCFFLFVSVFTKQDAGVLGFLVALALVVTNAVYEKKISHVLWFLGFTLVVGLAVVLPFIPYHIGYWFNYGQPPHNSRLSLYDLMDIFFGQSMWLKFYILAIVLIWMLRIRDFKDAIRDKQFVVFSVLVTGILAEAAIFQVTSYIPEYNNIFFHSFAFAYIFSYSGLPERIRFRKVVPLFFSAALILLWWSSRYWQYANRVIGRVFPHFEQTDTTEVSIRTFVLDRDPSAGEQGQDRSKWVFSGLKPFKKVYMPEGTEEGIRRLLAMPLVKEHGSGLKMLNMTELTPLEYVIGCPLETGTDIPLWFHKNVSMFRKQIDEYEARIRHHSYDLVLFEYIPILNNFYPFEIRDTLKKYYKQVDSFPGPRSNGYSAVEVYIKKSASADGGDK